MFAAVVAALVGLAAGSASGRGHAVPRYGKPAQVLSTDAVSSGGIASEDSADLNNDGYVDVFTTGHRWRTLDTFPLRVFLNDRRGGFVDSTSTIFEGPPPLLQWPRKVVVADFNNDGRPDIFVGDHGYDGEPGPGFHNTLVLSTPAGKLRDATGNLPPLIRFTHSATAADVNGDGAIDLYVGSIYTTSLHDPPELMLNDGAGKFSACGDCLPPLLSAPVSVNGSLQSGHTFTASQFVDVDNDRDQDLVLAGNGFYRIPGAVVSSDSQVLANDGTGHFSVRAGALPLRPWNNTAEGLDVKAADLDRDGYQDLAIAYTQMEPYYVGRWIQILINNRDGTFKDETAVRLPQAADNTGLWATQLSLVDFSGDGALDLVVELYEGAKEATPFYLNDGSGRFSPLPTGYGNVINNDFALVDARGDGHRDFFTSDDYAFPKVNHYLVQEVGGPEPPGPPAGVRVTRDPARRPVVSWSYDWGAAGYEVWRSATMRYTGKKLATTRLLRFVDKTAAPGRSFFYRVRAANKAGKSRVGQPVRAPAP